MLKDDGLFLFSQQEQHYGNRTPHPRRGPHDIPVAAASLVVVVVVLLNVPPSRHNHAAVIQLLTRLFVDIQQPSRSELPIHSRPYSLLNAY